MHNNENSWTTRDGKVIPLDQMEQGHLVNAFLNLCLREFQNFEKANEFFDKINTLQEWKDRLIEEASRRGINLVYPDQKFPSKRFKHYFEAERKTRIGEVVRLAPRKAATVGRDEENE